MGSIRCTLCCGETFQSFLELAEHLEKILEDIECACCRLKFNNFQSLLDHYKSRSQEENQFLKDFNNVENQLHWHVEESVIHETKVKEEESSELTSQAMEMDNEKDLSVCIPTAANSEATISNGEALYLEEGGSQESSSQESSFHCSCGMFFESLVDHLMNHHKGEEVIIKGDVEQIETLLDKRVDDDDNNKDPLVEAANVHIQRSIYCEPEVEPEVIICNRNADEVLQKVVQPSSTPLTPLQIDQLDGKVEECVDKDGRAYLRKFVRVKKFWSEEDEVLALQMKTKVRDYEAIRDVPIGSVSIKSKDEIVSSSQSGQPKRLYQCSECEKTFQTMIHFRYHVCSVKNGSAMTCNLCGHESRSTKDLRAHWRMHQRQRRVAATALWELQAGEGASVNKNIRKNEDVTELQCDRCGEMYRKGDELVHIAMHDEEPPYDCQKCKESFENREKLSRHMRSHKEQKTHNCIYCGKAFMDSNAYKLHVRTHTGEKPYECQYCAKKFSRPYERMKHERIHTGERPHVCEICGKTFRVSYCLTLHKRTHSGDRPYTCDTCGKRFKAHSAYKHHIQIHSDARNYKCPFCPKAFKTMVHLSGHKKTHTKPFLCTECNRRFASLYSMKLHMESHKAGKNSFRYRCFVCGASYARSFALHAHLSTHGPCDAPEDVAEVLEICGEDQKKEDGDIGILGECSKYLAKAGETSEEEMKIKEENNI